MRLTKLPDVRYAFKHALMQGAAYSTLIRKSRRAIHGAIVSARWPSVADVTGVDGTVLVQNLEHSRKRS